MALCKIKLKLFSVISTWFYKNDTCSKTKQNRPSKTSKMSFNFLEIFCCFWDTPTKLRLTLSVICLNITISSVWVLLILPPSLIVFCAHLYQLENSEGAFTMLFEQIPHSKILQLTKRDM